VGRQLDQSGTELDLFLVPLENHLTLMDYFSKLCFALACILYFIYVK
jgi:hypothetical protein